MNLNLTEITKSKWALIAYWVDKSKTLIKLDACLFFINLEIQDESFYIFFALHLLHFSYCFLRFYFTFLQCI